MSELRQSGFTLVEMIVVIVITGIIAGIVAIFIKAPVQGYVDSARRAELTDIADIALRRMARDVRRAVPNSLRSPNALTFEYVQAGDGGRYRSGPPGNRLIFNGSDTSFLLLDGAGGVAVAINDHLVIGSSQSDGSVVYNRLGLRLVSNYNSGTKTITMNQGLISALEMPTHRFDVIDAAQGAVSYVCEGVGTDGNGTGTGVLRRYWNYWDFSANRTVWAAPVGGSSALLADRVSGCTVEYVPANQGFGLLSVSLTLTEANESVTLHHQMHVNNVP